MIDVAKIAAALERAGIDPRSFVTLGVVTALKVDAKGVHFDITTITGLKETATLATHYGGVGYGFHCPIEIGTLVLVAIPEGNLNAGARIIGSAWDEGQPPPADIADHPEDVVMVVKPGKAIRIVVAGGGNAIIEARDNSLVQLGGEDAILGVARLDDPVLFDWARIEQVLDQRYMLIPPAGPLPRELPDAVATLPPTVPDATISGASTIVVSK